MRTPDDKQIQELVAMVERVMPDPDDGSVRALSKMVLVAEFSDSDGARQIAFAGHATTLWDILGLLEYAKADIASRCSRD